MEFVWPIQSDWDHFNASEVLERPNVFPHWNLVVERVHNIEWEDVLQLHEHEFADKRMSISQALGDTLKVALLGAGSSERVPMFEDGECGGAPFVIEQKMGPIAIDFAFGHYNEIPWKLARLAATVMPSEMHMPNPCTIGILLTPTQDLKKAGKFDSTGATWEKAKSYLRAIGSQWQAPMMLMGIKNPDTFVIIDHGLGAKPRSSVRYL